ncbi:MAG: PaaI family thioesterase [Haloarculaceae archaeon]
MTDADTDGEVDADPEADADRAADASRDVSDPAEDGEFGSGRNTDVEAAQTVLDQHGFLSWLGIEFVEVEEGRAVMRVPHQEKLANWSGGSLHGGVTATVVDSCSAFALRTTFPDPLDPMLVTTDLTVRYVRPATSDITVAAEVVRAGESMGMTHVEVTGTAPSGEEKVVATGGTTYRMFKNVDHAGET